MFPFRVGIRPKKFCFTPSFFLIPLVLLVGFLCSAEVVPVRDDVGRVFFFWQDSDNSGRAYRKAAISITVNPSTSTVAPGATIQFTATVTNTSNTAVTWAASSGSISSTGLFTAPNQLGTVTITATSGAFTTVQASATVSVSDPSLAAASAALPNAQVGSAYSATLAAQGGTPPYSWSLSSGSLPQGLALNSTTGEVSGTPGQSGSFTFTAKVTDAYSETSTQQLTLVTASSPSSSGGGSSSGSGSYDGPAELPRVHVQSAMADTPAPGSTIIVPAGSNLQAVLNAASCGDTIQLQAGAVFTGNVNLPAKGCDDSHWIIIRTSAPDSALPPEGTRISPCYAGVASLPARPGLNCTSVTKVMATLMAGKGGPITLSAGATHYRLGPGLDITRPVGTGINYSVIAKDMNVAADHIVIDRDWVHGTERDDTTRGLNLSGITYAAVVDSYFSDFHCTALIGACIDSQAISGGSGPVAMGAWKIENNFLEAAGENILFGGGAGNTTPADIEIRHNHMFKPLIWMPGQSGFVGGVNNTNHCSNTPGQCPFIVKNLFELKNAQRLLFEGNILENVWGGFTQHGNAVLFTPLSQGGTLGNPNATVADITFRFNHVSHTASGMVIAEVAYQWGPPKLEARISIHDDIFDDISSAYDNGEVMATQVAFEILYCSSCNPLHDVKIDHVTMLMQSPRMLLNVGAPVGLPIKNFQFTNSIISSLAGLAVNGTGSNAPCGFYGSTNFARIKSCITSYSMTANALVGASGTWPAGNFFPLDPAAVQFTDYSQATVSGSYTLLSSSPYKGAATDGTDLGANVPAVDDAVAGVL